MNSWAQLLAVAAGGAGGAVLRYLVNELFRARAMTGLPWATLSVNVIGCLLAGALLVWLESRGPGSLLWRNLLMVGFLGGLTTFSAFGVELLQFLRLGRVDLALLMIGLNVGLGLAAVVAGWKAGRILFAA